VVATDEERACYWYKLGVSTDENMSYARAIMSTENRMKAGGTFRADLNYSRSQTSHFCDAVRPGSEARVRLDSLSESEADIPSIGRICSELRVYRPKSSIALQVLEFWTFHGTDSTCINTA
jgi:hypothetical protein